MRYLLLFLSFALYGQSHAQQLPDYYVYLVNGEAGLTRPGAKSMTLKQYQLVYKTDLILLKKGAELTLVDKDAQFLMINTAGTYKADELAKKGVTKDNEGMTGKYLKLLFHELFDPNHDFEKFKKENIAGVWGGVNRNEGCRNLIFPVNGLTTSANLIIFKWHITSPSSNYSFLIYDGQGKEMVKMNTKDTIQTLNITKALKGSTGKYFWLVKSKDATCEDEVPLYLDIISSENEKALVVQLAKTIGSESLETQLQQIDKLEKNALIYAATDRYAKMVKANPENKALLKSYVVFLLKYGFDEEAQLAWKPVTTEK